MFSFEELENCESYLEKIDYAKQHLELLGEGISRNVFVLDEKRVIKFAKNEDGIFENNVEKNYSDSNWERLARVLEYDEDFMWVVCEKSSPITEESFEQMTGINMDDFYNHLYMHRMIKMMPSGDSPPSGYDLNLFIETKLKDAEKNKLSKEINQKSDELGFFTGDIPRLDNLGIMERNGKPEIVIVDYGAFDNKFRKFPSENKNSISPQ